MKNFERHLLPRVWEGTELVSHGWNGQGGGPDPEGVKRALGK